MTVTPSGLKSRKVLWQMKTNCESQEWSSYRKKKPQQFSVTQQNATNPWQTKSTLRMRGFSLEETGLYSGESEPETRAISLECGHEFEVCVGLIFGIPLKITWELGQRMPDVATVCMACLCTLIHNSCPAWDWSNEHTSGWSKGVCHVETEWESTSQRRRL